MFKILAVGSFVKEVAQYPLPAMFPLYGLYNKYKLAGAIWKGEVSTIDLIPVVGDIHQARHARTSLERIGHISSAIGTGALITTPFAKGKVAVSSSSLALVKYDPEFAMWQMGRGGGYAGIFGRGNLLWAIKERFKGKESIYTYRVVKKTEVANLVSRVPGWEETGKAIKKLPRSRFKIVDLERYNELFPYRYAKTRIGHVGHTGPLKPGKGPNIIWLIKERLEDNPYRVYYSTVHEFFHYRNYGLPLDIAEFEAYQETGFFCKAAGIPIPQEAKFAMEHTLKEFRMKYQKLCYPPGTPIRR